MKTLTPVEKVQTRAFFSALQESSKIETTAAGNLIAQVHVACRVLAVLHPDILIDLLNQLSGSIEDMSLRCKNDITAGIAILEKGPIHTCTLAGREAVRSAVCASVKDYGSREFHLLAWAKWAIALTEIITCTTMDVVLLACREEIVTMEHLETQRQHENELRKEHAAIPFARPIMALLTKVKHPITKSEIMLDFCGPGTHEKSLKSVEQALEALLLRTDIHRIEMVNKENNSVVYAYTV